MVQVTELGYMGLGVKDLDEWKAFATDIIGMELADEGERDRVYCGWTIGIIGLCCMRTAATTSNTWASG